MFGRKKRSAEGEITDADVEGFVDDLSPEDRAHEDAELEKELALQEAGQRREVARPQGPWDVEDAPETERLDLGALQVHVTPGLEVRLEMSAEGTVMAVTLVHGDSTAQVNAFAAPRSEGIWGEVRAEIAEALTGSGGSATEAEGVLGTELRATVPQEVPGRGVVLAPARFLGVDGPRWFLRALLTGPAATEDAAARPLVDAVRDMVVVRGADPMPAREPLVIVLPAEAQQQVDADAEQDPDGLSLPERGPEITEVR